MNHSEIKRVLFVAYLFPPTGGVGVHRAAKFVKYLPEYGWETSVLTVSNPSVPLKDESLCKEIPEQTIIRRARTLEPGYGLKNAVSGSKQSGDAGKPSLIGTLKSKLKSTARTAANVMFQPDLQILWKRNAVKEGLSLLEEVKHDAIIATAPPFSSFLVGEELARKSGLPLILDYRDEWGISNKYWENKQQNSWAQRTQTKMQNRVVAAADIVLATTPGSRDSVAEVAKNVGSSARAEYIYNGYDPDDFATSSALTKKDYGNGTDLYRLAYAGTLWNLNSVEPLVEAVTQLAQKSPKLVERMELVFAGRRTDAQNSILDRLEKLPCKLVRLPFIDHDEAVCLMQTADGLVLLNSNVPDAERIVSGKAFEYIAAKRPIFIISPKGEMWDLLKDCPYAYGCPPDQPGIIANHLEDDATRHFSGVGLLESNWNPSQFERKYRAEELAGLLDSLKTKTNKAPANNKKIESREKVLS